MYYFYPSEILTPFQWVSERNTPLYNMYSYLPYSNVFYYQNYLSVTPDLLNAGLKNEVQGAEEDRGSWTPFSWVEKYAYAFSGPYNKAEVALTFDDGPDFVFTPQILDKLKNYGVKATFFLLGENAERYPDVVKRIANEGHTVGNHTYNHPNLVKVSDEEYRNQIVRTEEILQKLIGYAPKFIRPPYGEIREKQLEWATEQNFMTVQWSVDTVDWKGVSAEQVTNTVLGNAFPGSVILQHSTPGGHLQGSVDALDRIITELKAKGSRFVTLPNMFHTSKQRK
ncbi:polysaccharide deacetylase family protein [Bacillus pseudomycoides]|uniref:peptidoglycan-N-acetylglucosamine deacetylase n=1 Tax=Bacillus TaxID=1386 RepID=UPI0001A151F6|nr:MULTISPECIES: polysaccharide deacetylase family protein [Bacillus]EEM17380.1 Peptidoglycan N-acetylglucosamine deacetylase [Bacillus pseudomycoides DSM 12442]MCX2827311.1 polysaccharide deacetylase family protein [Bacillus sp. DHT2]MDR4914732.1 polysaccharide deacetylase family protein [Bacillus pseudomycoides]MED1596105.1 polysaccharide deacetylase family protein [Bacillus pseudomycoides]MED4650106.1 polysaccharide deacetylase family protein [Bacillus pseudomycoides]